MVSRSELKEDAFDLALGILEVAKDPDHGIKHSKHFSPIFKWDLQKEWLHKFSTHPKPQPLVEEQFDVPWPSFEAMRAMPVGSLGFCAQQMFNQLGIDPLPPVNKNLRKVVETNEKEEYLSRRLRKFHDIFHLVLGVDTSVAGEPAVQAYVAVSQQQPAVIAILSASMTHSFIYPDEHRMIWEAISFGAQVGFAGAFLEGCRWEEGWERPLAEWRSELGLTHLMENSPFQEEIHRWETFSSSKINTRALYNEASMIHTGKDPM